MAKCKKGNCDKQANPKGTPADWCADHQRLKKQEDDKQARVKKQMEDKLKETEEARKQMAIKAKKLEETAEAKKKEVTRLAGVWNNQVNAVVTQVKNLRNANPGNNGINAGKNGTLGTIPGGTDNPISFALPSTNTYKIAKADIFAKMKGFDSSDSGTYKFRVDGVLVHGD